MDQLDPDQVAFADEHVGGTTSACLDGTVASWLPAPKADHVLLLAEGADGVVFSQLLHCPPSEATVEARGAAQSQQDEAARAADAKAAEALGAERAARARENYGRTLAEALGRDPDKYEDVLGALGKLIDSPAG